VSVINLQKQMLEKVADALGGDLLPKVVFV